jgi:HK97 family phage prohead protease
MVDEHREKRRANPKQCRVRVGAINVKSLEQRAEGDGLPDIVGHAAVFDTRTELWPGTTEEVAPGAFSRSLKEGDDVRALRNHDAESILGRLKAGTLSLKEDKRGLWTRISPPDTVVGRDTVELIRRGDMDQMSFAFRIVREEAEYDDDGVHYRLLDVDLIDVSVVAFPAYENTDAELDEERAIVTMDDFLRRVHVPDAKEKADAGSLRWRARIQDLGKIREADEKRAVAPTT